MKQNEKIARQLLRLAKMMLAADDNGFIQNYIYTDANPDFKTEGVNRGEGVVSFSVVLTPSVKLDVNVTTGEGNSATVTTRWNIEYNVYKNGGFKPETSPKETKVEAGSADELSEKVTQVVAACTEGLSVTK